MSNYPAIFHMAELLFSLRLKLIIKAAHTHLCARCEYVRHTLSLEGVQVVSEGVCRFSLLQDTQVAQFLHLRFLCLPLPHRNHDLKNNKSKISQMPPQC